MQNRAKRSPLSLFSRGEIISGSHYEDFMDRSSKMLADRLKFLAKRGNIFFERVNFGHDDRGEPMLATKIEGRFIPDFDFWFCFGREIVDRYGLEAAVVAAYVKREIRHVGTFMVSTQTGEIVAARKLVPE